MGNNAGEKRMVVKESALYRSNDGCGDREGCDIFVDWFLGEGFLYGD